ncbi:MAG: hypothetical protein IJK05_02845 [Bacteroidales bacterium]|nr:hypothetical protein [Bacteroidales bacterium]
MEARHVFVKGRFGFGVFYRAEDFIVYITIVSALVREMSLTVLAFCPMFNHIHFLFKDIEPRKMRSFIQRMAIIFVKEYNKEYDRRGTLFQKPFGCSVKRAVKIIMGSVAYVFNNPVAGKLCGTAKEYRWNLLAYLESANPFSKPLRKEKARNQMRAALKKVDYFHSVGKPLSYAALRDIFKCLDKEEQARMTDYILTKYNFLSAEWLETLYGSYGKMITAIDSNAGSEFDIEDEYGDHSCYRSMLRLVMKSGYKGRELNFEKLDEEEARCLFRRIMTATKASPACVNKFLHIENNQ